MVVVCACNHVARDTLEGQRVGDGCREPNPFEVTGPSERAPLSFTALQDAFEAAKKVLDD